jgi:sugar lactone lactonase YvrE
MVHRVFLSLSPLVLAGLAVAPVHSNDGWMAKTANPKHPWMYVSGTNSHNVLVYDLAKFGAPQIGSITSGINGPRGLFVDEAGNLYVANQGGANVALYSPGATTPSLVLSQGLSQPVSAAVDPQGNVWVTNEGSQPSIVVYPPGGTTPSETITDPLIKIPQQITFDPSGNAYFADNSTGVSEILAGTTQPVSLQLERLAAGSSNGMAIDPHDGTLFVSFGNVINQVNVYGAGHRKPRRILSAPSADGLAIATIGRQEDLFVPASQLSTVVVFRTHGDAPIGQFAVNTQYTRSVAVKAAGVP